MNYKLLTGTADSLQRKVQTHLAAGWELKGETVPTGARITIPAYRGSGYYTDASRDAYDVPEFAQAVIRHEPTEERPQ